MKLNSRIKKELFKRPSMNYRSTMLWRAYLLFLESCPNLPTDTPGSALHHILWRSEYPRFIDCQWNIIRLSYSDHAAAAALALGAEPENKKLWYGFRATYKMYGTPRRWKPRNAKEIIRLYEEERWSMSRLGLKFGIDVGAVRRWLKRNGIKTRGYSEQSIWFPKTADKIIQLYTKEKWSLSKLGKRYKVSCSTVRHFLSRNGVLIRTLSEQALGKKLSPSQKKNIGVANTWKPLNPERIISMYYEGYTIQKLSRKYNKTRTTIKLFLLRNKVTLRSRSASQIIRRKKEKKSNGHS